jgi:predicted dehydrogenase
VQALKSLIDKQLLGEIFMVAVDCYWNRNNEYYFNSNWKGKKSLDGGTLYNQFSHFIDLFYYLFGDIENIQGMIKNVNHKGLIEFEDSGVFTFNFKSGALGSMNFTTAAFEKNMEGSITVFAENASIKLGGQYLNKIDYQRTRGFDITNLPESGPSNVYGYYQGSMSNHDKVIANVVDTLNGKSAAMTSAEDGLKVVDIIERMYAAAKVL